MITIHYDFTNRTEVSYQEGFVLFLKNRSFTTHVLHFFNWDFYHFVDKYTEIKVLFKDGSYITTNNLLGQNPYTAKEIRKEHNITKLLISGTLKPIKD